MKYPEDLERSIAWIADSSDTCVARFVGCLTSSLATILASGLSQARSYGRVSRVDCLAAFIFGKGAF